MPERPMPNPTEDGGRTGDPSLNLESRVAAWVRTRIGPEHMNRRERAMRLLEEAAELAQAEGVTSEQASKQMEHVFRRPAGDPAQEAGGVAVCLLAWCAATGNTLHDIATREVERIEAKPVEEIRGSVARKQDADLVRCEPAPVIDLAEVVREVDLCRGIMSDAANHIKDSVVFLALKGGSFKLAAVLAKLREVKNGR